MSAVIATPDSNPTRAQLRLVVLGQWVRAGLDLARGAGAGRGLIGGAVALWRVFQAVRLAIQLIQRLSEVRDVLSRAASESAPGGTAAPGLDFLPDDPPGAAAFLRDALVDISRTLRDALGLVPDRRGRSSDGKPARPRAELPLPRAPGRISRPRGRPPDRPPKPQRWRRPRAARLNMVLTPLAAPASGRLRLGAG